MKMRVTFLVPLLLVISTLVISVMLYANAKYTAEARIRSEVLAQLKLDITRLQNVLYNRLTERGSNFEEARLNLSITAMEPTIRTLLLVDDQYRIILANRYSLEGENASNSVSMFDADTATRVLSRKTPVVEYLEENDRILTGYFPVVLQLESRQGEQMSQNGMLYVEESIANKLEAAFVDAANQSIVLAILMLIVSLFLAWLLYLIVSKRLNRLGEVARQLAEGDLDARAGLGGNDELAMLGRSFDAMANQIKRDITRRLDAEARLRDLNETLEQRVSERTDLLQEAQHIGRIGNWIWDVASGDLYWSDEIYRIFGYEPGEIAPSYERFLAMVHPDDVGRIKQSEEDAFSMGRQHNIDHRIILPGGEERWVHEAAIATIGKDGRPISLSGTVQDITERKHAEHNLMHAKEEAERASLAKSVFLSRMSHELRTPLNAILGFSQVLQLDTISDEQRQFVDEIRNAGDHLLLLISELLDMSRIESGRMMVVMQSVMLSDVMNSAVNLIGGIVDENDLELSVECDESHHVIADTARLRQVLVNILSNAAKYNKKSGSIRVRCQSQNGVIRISITDTGIGIKPEYIDRLFMPFERLDAERSGVDGAGIGLALSKQLVELMNGRIGVESTPGQGSTFWIELVIVDAQKKKDGDKPFILRNQEAGCTVLYIEDNLANYRVVEAMLRRYPGMNLIYAGNGSYGLELANEYLPDIILLDIHLPDIGGYEVLHRLRSMLATSAIPVIALSADAMPIDIDRGLAAGFNDYLTKPIDANNLVATLTRYSIHCD